MLATITAERPDTPDALLLIDELQTHLESFYPPESRHGFSVERLIKEGVTFFVLWVEDPVDHEGVHVDVELRPLPKRWITVTVPVRPSWMPCERAVRA